MSNDRQSGQPGQPSQMDVEELTREIEKLYQLPLGEFVSARNQLAARLRKQDRAVADAIKQVSKPSVSAWAVNQVYWQAQPEFESLLRAGDKVRTLQTRALAGEALAKELQAAMTAQRAAVAVVLARAERVLAQAGHNAGQAMLRRVSMTLEALALHGRDDAAPRPGRLSEDVVSTQGFDALAAIDANAMGLAQQPAQTGPTAGPEALLASGGNSASKGARVIAHPNAVARGQAAAGGPGTSSGTRPGTGQPDAGRGSANDNRVDAAAERQRAQVAARMARRKAREQARIAVDEARALLASCKRATADAKDTEKSALDRVYAAEKAIATAERELVRATGLRDRALDSAEQAKKHTETAHTSMDQAAALLRQAEKRLKELE